MVGAWSTCLSIITAHDKVWLNDDDDNDDRSSGAIVKEHAAGWVDGWVHTYVRINVAPRGKIRIRGGKPTVSMVDVL